MMPTQGTVDLTDIQGELNRLWDSLEGTDKIRACLFNLIVYTHDEQRIEYFQNLIQLVIEKLPCRILFIKGRPDGSEDYLRTSVSAESSGTGNSVIACDMISIEAAGQHLERVPFLILPNIVPDLPVYLLWGHDPTEDDHILPQLQKVANRVIFDSECICDMPKFSRKLLGQMDKFQAEIADMNWARTRGWRDVISQVFNSPELIHSLGESKFIKLVYNHKPTTSFQHCDTQALFIQSWIAAQLNWKLESYERSEGNTRVEYSTAGRSITVILSPGLVEDHSPGTPLQLEIETHGGEHFNIERQPNSKAVRVQKSSADKCEIPYRLLLGRLTVDQSLMNEVLYESLGQHYNNMLKVLSTIQVR